MGSNLPVLLYGIVKGVSDDAIKGIFGQQRIHVDFVDQRPQWAQQYSGTMIEIQTLFGEYGGWLGSAAYESEVQQAKLSVKTAQERKANIAKMMAVIAELASHGELTLMLRTTEFISGRLPRQKTASEEVTEEFLLKFPHNTIVTIPASAYES
jgi:hypothetical protein